MVNVVEYRVIESYNVLEMSRAVDEAIRHHWQPFGGISVSSPDVNDTTKLHYAQAMVMYG